MQSLSQRTTQSHLACPGRAMKLSHHCGPCRSRHAVNTQAIAAAATGIITTGLLPSKLFDQEVDPRGVERIKYDASGWNFLDWQGHKVHWVAAGPQDGPPVLLVHGYGASAYHWRYQIPELAKQGYRVYAICLLGFGWSTKALVNYTNGVQWVAQISDFITEVVGTTQAVTLVGNSLGGYASLATAAVRPDLIRAVALLNGAGPLQVVGEPVRDPDVEPGSYDQLLNALQGLVKRVVMWFGFLQAKQPGRIREVLQLVYTNKEQVDDDLVDSIVQPAMDPLASEVFFRLNHGNRPPLTVNALLQRIQVPLLLLHGMKDPWITPSRAAKVMALCVEAGVTAQLVPLPAGHCPHDDSPVLANAALLTWLRELPAVPLAAPRPLSLANVAARLRTTL